MAGMGKEGAGRMAYLWPMELGFELRRVITTQAVSNMLKRVDIGTLAGMAVETQEDWQMVTAGRESLLLMVGPWLDGKEVAVLVRAGRDVEGNLQVAGSLNLWDKAPKVKGVAWESASETWILPINLLNEVHLEEEDREGWRLVG